LRRAQDGGPTTKHPQSTHNHNHSTYPYSRGRGRYQYPKFAPARPAPPPKSVEIGGEIFKASTNKLTRQTSSGAFIFMVQLGSRPRDSNAVDLTNLCNVSSDPSSSSSTPTPASYPSSRGKSRPPRARGRFAMQQSGIRVYKPRLAGRGHHANMSLVLNKVNKCALLSEVNHCSNYRCASASRKAKLEKQCPFFSRTGAQGISHVFR
jgi:hypothetical protein